MKNNLIKIIIIFFVFNIIYFIIFPTYADDLHLSVSIADISIKEEEEKTIEVVLDDPSIGDKLINNAKPSGVVSISAVKDNKKSNQNQTVWKVVIKGQKKGKTQITFMVNGKIAPTVTVTVNDKNSASGSTNSTNTVTINTDILRDDFAEEFDPNSEIGGYNVSQPIIKVIIPVVNRILAILQIIGAIVLVIALAIAGFNGILGSGDGFSEDLGLNVGSSINEYGNSVTGVQNLTKGSLSKILRRAFIGTIILEFSATFVRIVFSIVTNI